MVTGSTALSYELLMSICSFYWLERLPEWVAGHLDGSLTGLLAACVPVFDSSDTRPRVCFPLQTNLVYADVCA